MGEHLVYPAVIQAPYPYTPDGNREFLEDKPFIDPLCLASMLGAVTKRLRFHTFVVKLPIRHPVLVAKQLASVAVLTGNRFGFGVGLSPWPDDYRFCAVPWEGRGKRMDEMIAIVRGLLRGGYFHFEGEHFQIESIKMCPVPSEPVPILVGGHSDAALERAARFGDGWMHGGGDAAELPRLLARLAELIVGFRKAYEVDRMPLEKKLDAIRRYGDSIIART